MNTMTFIVPLFASVKSAEGFGILVHPREKSPGPTKLAVNFVQLPKLPIVQRVVSQLKPELACLAEGVP